jgi:hypothetical protein
MSRRFGGRREMTEVDCYPYCTLRMPIANAVPHIAIRFGIVRAEAIEKLLEALGAGRIKAYWRGKYDGSRPLIERHRWVGATIDIKKQVVTVTDPVERMAFVDLERTDVEIWLASISPEPAPTAIGQNNGAEATQDSGGAKFQLAREAAIAIWGKPAPPPGLPPQQVFRLVADKVGKLAPGVTIGKSQALRALGLKK